LGRLGARAGPKLDGQGLTERFGEPDQTIARCGLGFEPGASGKLTLPGTGGSAMTAPEEAEAGQDEDDRQADREEDAGDRPGLQPGLGAEIGARGDEAPRDCVVHAGPRRVARWEKSSIRGTIGSASVVMVNAWMPEFAHQRWNDVARRAAVSV